MIHVSIDITDEGATALHAALEVLLPTVEDDHAYVVLRRFRALMERAELDRDQAAARAERRRVRALRLRPPTQTIRSKHDESL